ncbi:MAG TPA: SCO family protein [Ktedonobacteraceae bacterium]|nr:SCO family protein [Ktedonobacteraceae bacterium]
MRHTNAIHKLALVALLITSTLVVIVATAWGVRFFASLHNNQAAAQSVDNTAIAGFPMPGNLAPDFTLTDQFGRSVTLSSLRGHEVVLAFIDARCTSLCPLTAQVMYNAKAMLGSSDAGKVDLVAVNANPEATSIAEVQAWSINHGMLHQWEFLTGPAKQLNAIYHQYDIAVEVQANGSVAHDPATFIIDAQGHERLYFETLDSTAKADLNDEEVGMKDGMLQWLPRQA